MARRETRSSKEKVPAIRHTMCNVYPWTTPSKWRGVKHDRSRSIDPKRSRSDNFNEFLFAANSIKSSINRRKTGMHEYGSSAKHQAHQTPVFSYNSLVYKTIMHEYGSSEKHQAHQTQARQTHLHERPASKTRHGSPFNPPAMDIATPKKLIPTHYELV